MARRNSTTTMTEWLFQDAEDALRLAFGTATRQLRVIAPYIKLDMLQRLLVTTDPEVPLTVITEWTVADVVLGASDLGVFDLVLSRPRSLLLLCPRLHAKLYIIDSAACFTGSANVTIAAMGGGRYQNREILGWFRPVPLPLLQFAEELERHSIPVTEALRQHYLQLAAKYPPPTLPELSIEHDVEVEYGSYRRSILSDLPKSRNPESVFAIYAGAEAPAWAVEAAAHDLALLAVPQGLSKVDFHCWIREHLLGLALVQEFDEHLVQPRYFGRMTDWLARRCDLRVERQTLKEAVQMLMRWLLWAYPERYRLDVPHYSERFGRVDADWRH